jgi:hypothetical protein
MSTSPDFIQIEELYQSSTREPNKNFALSQWKNLRDNNLMNYTNNINFDMQDIKKQRVILRDSFLQIPYTVQSATATALQADSVFGWKGSSLSLFSGIIVEHVGNSTLVNENYGTMHMINNIRLLTESDYDLYDSELRQIAFFKDDTNNITAGTNEFTTTAGAFSARNAAYNSALKKRMTAMNLTFDAGTGIFSGTAIIPLKYVHDLFDKLDFPCSNLHLSIKLLLNTAQTGAQYPCMYHGTAAHDQPVVVNIAGPTYLWYRTVNFKGEDEARYMNEMNSGLSKTIKFISTESIRRSQDNATNNQEVIIGNSMKNVLRVWNIPFSRNELNPTAGATSNTNLTPMVCTNSLSNYNLIVDGTQYYENNINLDGTRDFEAYNVLKTECLPSSGRSLISYDEFRNLFRYYPISIVRGKDKFDGSSRTTSLSFRATASAAQVDNLFILEKLSTISVNFTTGTSQIITN